MNITNVRPDLSDFGGFANLTYGNRDLMSVQGAVNVPISQDTLALRVTGAYRQRDGYIDVVDATGAKIGESNGADQYQVNFECDLSKNILITTSDGVKYCMPFEFFVSSFLF